MGLTTIASLLVLSAFTNALPTLSSETQEIASHSTFSPPLILNYPSDRPVGGYQTCPGNCRAPTGCCVYLAGLWYCGICDKKDESPDKIGKVVNDIEVDSVGGGRRETL